MPMRDSGTFHGDKITEDLNIRLRKTYLTTLCKRPARGVTEVLLSVSSLFVKNYWENNVG